MGDQLKRTGAIRGIVDVVDATDQVVTKTFDYPIADAGAGGDISETAIWRAPQAITLIDIGILNGSDASISVKDGQTSVWTIKNSANTTIVAETFDSTTAFPGANTYQSLGALGTTAISADDTLTLTLTNGAQANLGALKLQGEYK